jgi:hypothetical protein
MVQAVVDKFAHDLPTVRVGIGMSIADLKAGSTYPFFAGPTVGTGPDFQAFQITTPYNLVFVDTAGELKLNNLGGPRELTNITVKEGVVTDLSVTIQTGRTNLRQAMVQAQDLYKWFGEHGFKATPENHTFWVQHGDSEVDVGTINNFAQAEAAFLDPRIKLSAMVLFGLRKNDVNVGVELSNGRRMRAKHNKAHDDESNALNEKKYGLDLVITETIKPYIAK